MNAACESGDHFPLLSGERAYGPMKRRAVVIVLDGVGVGALPDADRYGDSGADSLGNTARAVGGLRLPLLAELGLGNIAPIKGVPPTGGARASWGRMAERSPGKDSVSGHWELMGCPLAEPFPVYPNGFPREVVGRFERAAGTGVLGNRPDSGTEIIRLLGEEHMRTGKPIVYTSADSVFQIAAHEDVISPEKLYGLCRIAREILTGPHAVGRVIARPFTGQPGSFTRTKGRKDFSLPPPGPTLLDRLSEQGFRVVSVGKIHHLFAGRGIDEPIAAAGSDESMRAAYEFVRGGQPFSFLFINLIDFDMLWGHRRDAGGYAGALERFDRWLSGFIEILEAGTLLFLTSDHGCDPTMRGSDHTREYVPVLVSRVGSRRGRDLGTRESFSDLAATIANYFSLEDVPGESFLDYLPGRCG
jgi:phosphopentomutase